MKQILLFKVTAKTKYCKNEQKIEKYIQFLPGTTWETVSDNEYCELERHLHQLSYDTMYNDDFRYEIIVKEDAKEILKQLKAEARKEALAEKKREEAKERRRLAREAKKAERNA